MLWPVAMQTKCLETIENAQAAAVSFDQGGLSRSSGTRCDGDQRPAARTSRKLTNRKNEQWGTPARAGRAQTQYANIFAAWQKCVCHTRPSFFTVSRPTGTPQTPDRAISERWRCTCGCDQPARPAEAKRRHIEVRQMSFHYVWSGERRGVGAIRAMQTRGHCPSGGAEWVACGWRVGGTEGRAQVLLHGHGRNAVHEPTVCVGLHPADERQLRQTRVPCDDRPTSRRSDNEGRLYSRGRSLSTVQHEQWTQNKPLHGLGGRGSGRAERAAQRGVQRGSAHSTTDSVNSEGNPRQRGSADVTESVNNVHHPLAPTGPK